MSTALISGLTDVLRPPLRLKVPPPTTSPSLGTGCLRGDAPIDLWGGRRAIPVWRGSGRGGVYPRDFKGEFCDICLNAPTFLAHRMESRRNEGWDPETPEALRFPVKWEAAWVGGGSQRWVFQEIFGPCV